ncbi:hypothetical protein SAMN05428983_5127 [Agrobacterium fabrum]|jgi:hypothetical protein|uniref:Uncharacterized protein n=1 Tax=Agrobacterium fabrum TaxID=1176649 RepID=A0A7Z7BSR3_9HYPH|nr:hypothetical protein SAMN05428983_5127 [Agrobacterium fabrum]
MPIPNSAVTDDGGNFCVPSFRSYHSMKPSLSEISRTRRAGSEMEETTVALMDLAQAG